MLWSPGRIEVAVIIEFPSTGLSFSKDVKDSFYKGQKKRQPREKRKGERWREREEQSVGNTSKIPRIWMLNK